MFHEIGAFDAKAKLSELLRAVSSGKCYRITVRGKPVADLVPSTVSDHHEVDNAIAAMRNFKKIKGIAAEEVNHMITEGRR
jgi:prevent-host-death family protein